MLAALPLPALHASHGGSWLRGGSGNTQTLSKGDAIVAAGDTPLLMLNAPLVATRLGYPDLSGLDYGLYRWWPSGPLPDLQSVSWQAVGVWHAAGFIGGDVLFMAQI